MPSTFRAAILLAAGAVAAAPAAQAEVTAGQVWSGWRASMTDAGYDVTSTETRAGDRLTITDLVMRVDMPEDNSTLTVTMAEMAFVDNGDGTVSVVLPPDLPIGVSVSGEDTEEVDLGMSYETVDQSITVSGDPDDMTFAYAAASAGLSLVDVVVEGQPVDMAEFGGATLTIADLAGTTRVQLGDDLRRSVQQVSSGALSYLMDFSEPEGGDGRILLRGGADAMDIRADVSLPRDMDPERMGEMLKQGFAVDVGMAFEGGTSRFEVAGDGQAAQGSSHSTDFNLRLAMDGERLSYGGEVSGLDISMAGGDLPFPVDIAMEKTGFNIEMPTSGGATPQPFALGLTLGGFTTSEMIWGMLDPAGQLPRDPATVAFDITGTARLTAALLDAGKMAAMDFQKTLPVKVDALRINGLTVSAAGAELTGAGGFTFDNSDTETFQGMPAPDGEINLTLVGGNGLLDTLVGMGLVPEDQANGLRMMMGLFAVPAEGEDRLTSKIEVKPDGQIVANGQRIQ